MKYLGLIFFLSLLLSCSSRQVNPDAFRPEAADQKTAQFGPSADELAHQPRTLVEILSFVGSTVTVPRKTQILSFLHDGMERFGDFSYISPDEIQAQLGAKAFETFQPTSAVDSIALASALNSDFVAQVELQITESKLKEGIDQFKALIQLVLFKVDTGQLVFKESIPYQSEGPVRSKKVFKYLIQRYFPLKGFILETKGSRSVARISLGSSLGIQIGRKVAIHSRMIQTQLIEGQNRRRIIYSPKPQAIGEVVQVEANDAWIWVPKARRTHFSTGDAVFTLPEKSRSLF